MKVEILKKDKELSDLKHDKKNLEVALEGSETNVKKGNKALKLKEKEVYDLQKDNVKVKKELDQRNVEHRELKALVNKEKKDQERKRKKQENKDFLNQSPKQTKFNVRAVI